MYILFYHSTMRKQQDICNFQHLVFTGGLVVILEHIGYETVELVASSVSNLN